MSRNSRVTDPEALLWCICVNDDTEAFEVFFGLFYPPLLMYARRYVHEQATCEDIVQDVFVWLWENRKKLPVIHSIRAFLVVSVRNRCLNYLKSNHCTAKHQEFMPIDRSAPQTHEERIYLLSELYELLEKTLSGLPANYRIVFEMSCLEGEQYAEIAKKLGVSVRTIKRYKKTVIEILKVKLKQ